MNMGKTHDVVSVLFPLASGHVQEKEIRAWKCNTTHW